MGNTLPSTLPSGSSHPSAAHSGSIDLATYIVSLPAYTFQRVIGNGRILKSLQCLHDSGQPSVIRIRLSDSRTHTSNGSVEARVRGYESVGQQLVDRVNEASAAGAPLHVLPLSKID